MTIDLVPFYVPFDMLSNRSISLFLSACPVNSNVNCIIFLNCYNLIAIV